MCPTMRALPWAKNSHAFSVNAVDQATGRRYSAACWQGRCARRARGRNLMSFFPRDAAAPADTAAPAIEWEEVSCLLCGGRHWSPLIEAPDNISPAGLWFAVVQCQECGLCFTNPRPSDCSIGSFYPPPYLPQRESAPSESRAAH